ncbi:MAG TPA: Holliday junction resolvase RuvX [Acidobacteriota bacterium]
MGLDVGARRIGVALSDESRRLALPLLTLERRSWRRDLEGLVALVRAHQVDLIVVGYPLRLDGTAGESARKMDAFITRLRGAGLQVATWDERLSSAEADRHLRSAGISATRRRGVTDRIAAALVLQSYLDAHPP